MAVHGFPFVDGAVLGCAVMGAVIVTRYERHPIGWLLSVIGFTSAISLLTEAYAIWVISEGGPGSRSLGGISGWVSSLVGGQLAIAGLALMFLLAPDGRLALATLAVRRGGDGARRAAVHRWPCSPRTRPRSTWRSSRRRSGRSGPHSCSVGFLLISAGLLASVVSMVVRLRRSAGRAAAAGPPDRAVGGAGRLRPRRACSWCRRFNGGEQTWAASLPLFVVLPAPADPASRSPCCATGSTTSR